jgi:addiction module HigA family antidote
MDYQAINSLKGIHPGIFLEKELKKRNIRKGRFAMSIGEYPQTLGAITNGKRGMNLALALKIEHALNIDEGFFMILQTFYEIKELKEQENADKHPDLSKFRKSIFWDTRFENINWISQKGAIIQRIFERGNNVEREEIIRFYGKEEVEKILQKS